MVAPRLISCTLVVATLALTACTSTVQGAGEPAASGVASPSTGASTPTALTADAYRGALGKQRDGVRDALSDVAAAKTIKTLDDRVERAEETLRGAAQSLSALAPPVEARVQHEAYVASLRDFTTELGTTLGRVGDRTVCTAGGVFADLSGKLQALDQTGKALRALGDYPADVVPVKVAKKQNRRLANGTFLRSGQRTGRGSLQIDNGASRDAVVTVLRGKAKAFSVYVRRKSSFKVRGVRDGTYEVYFTHGADWDGRAFTRSCSFERFEKSVRYRTTYTSTQIRWHDWRVTLHMVSGGNAPTATVDPESFPG
ncbi:hypothetical protein [Nonomuraea africana]|uniref:Small secreted protein n=1 Tax=Nonomuraea africana TaxID=46171 RepID=A0ABR9KGJ2_9ACTN|nr:hypothetical protein [Nonomuraea africana]MBE1561144.1 putative small secreted protein [Nonomuraea africana]